MQTQTATHAVQAKTRSGALVSTQEGTLDTDLITPVTHTLVGHPLLELDQLRALGNRLPADRVRWHLADIDVSQHFGRAAAEHPNGRSLDETLARLGESKSWAYLQQVEKDPQYRELVEQIIRSVRPDVERDDPGLHDFHGWIFCSSPNAVTPYHMDHESNFLLQIRGQKKVSVWDPRDRSVLAEEELEHFHALWSLDKTKWRDELTAKANVFDVKAGMGVFMPFTAPHAVLNGPDISITLSITFQTRKTKREQALFAANYRLRKLGVNPEQLGHSRILDSLKLTTFQLVDGARGVLKRKADALAAY